MNRQWRYLIGGIVLSGVSAAAFAAGEPGRFLSWGAGARSFGMGNAFVASVNDVYAAYGNPAALGRLEYRELGAFHAMLWEDSSYNFVGYAHPLLEGGTLGGSIVRLYSGGAEKRDENNVRTGSFSNQQVAVALSYGTNFAGDLSGGVSGKIVSSTLDSFSQNSFTFDAGLLLAPSPKLTLGANVQNIISGTLSDTEDRLPAVIRLGSGYRLFNDRLLVSLDVGRSLGAIPSDILAFGFEGTLNEAVRLRLGRNPDEITAGFGLLLNKTYNFDYALALHTLGPSHRISVNARFGPSITEARLARRPDRDLFEEYTASPTAVSAAMRLKAEEMQARFRETYQAAIALYERGLYTQAHDKFVLAQKYDPEDPNVPIYQERLKLIAPIVPQNISPDKTSELLRRGIAYFMEGNNDAAVKTIAYALSTEPDNFTIARLLTRIEEKTGIKAEYSKPVSGMSLVDQKLYEALIAFRRKDYSKVINLCEEVLILEPNNATAYKRLGSAFFSLGEKEKAIQSWRKALQITPDATLRRMIQELE